MAVPGPTWYQTAFLIVPLTRVDAMIEITVKFMSVARQRAGVSVVSFTSQESRLGDVLKAITTLYRVADIMLTENGEVKPWARVLVNGRSHELVGGLDVELHSGDSIALVYPYTENF